MSPMRAYEHIKLVSIEHAPAFGACGRMPGEASNHYQRRCGCRLRSSL